MNEHLKKRTVEAIDRAMHYCLKAQIQNGVGPVVINITTDKAVPADELYDTIMLLRSMILNKDEVNVLSNMVKLERQMISSAPGNDKWMARLKTILDKLEVLSGQS